MRKFFAAPLICFALVACGESGEQNDLVIVTGEEARVTLSHPTDPAKDLSIQIGSEEGVIVLDASGNVLHQTNDGRVVGIDVRDGFFITIDNGDPATAFPITVLAAANTTRNTLDVYMLEPDDGALLFILDEPVPLNFDDPVDLCLFRSAESDILYAFVSTREGAVSQWQLYDSGRGTVRATIQRTWSVGRAAGQCATDDVNGWFDVVEPGAGVWRYGAEPKDSFNDRTLVQ